MAIRGNSSLQNPAVLAALSSISNGRAPHPDDVAVTPVIYYHDKLVSGIAGKVTFFDVTDDEGVTNWFGNNGVPNDQVFIMDGASVDFKNGFDVDGSAVVGGQTVDIANAQNPMLIANARDSFNQHARFTLKKGKREIVDVKGIDQIPPGTGTVISGLTNPAATEDGQIVTSSNGVPSLMNRMLMNPLQYITPGDVIRGELRWDLTGLVYPSLVARALMFGVLVTEASK